MAKRRGAFPAPISIMRCCASGSASGRATLSSERRCWGSVERSTLELARRSLALALEPMSHRVRVLLQLGGRQKRLFPFQDLIEVGESVNVAQRMLGKLPEEFLLP